MRLIGILWGRGAFSLFCTCTEIAFHLSEVRIGKRNLAFWQDGSFRARSCESMKPFRFHRWAISRLRQGSDKERRRLAVPQLPGYSLLKLSSLHEGTERILSLHAPESVHHRHRMFRRRNFLRYCSKLTTNSGRWSQR